MVFLCLSVVIGAVTFTGSLVACAKLDDLLKVRCGLLACQFANGR
jgi:NAD/NADP transhydrogenase beta subunit